MILDDGQGVDDVARLLMQPLDFGFEVELGTRDWWLGGYSGVRFQRPRFRQGLEARWIDVTGQDFADVVERYLRRGLPVLFQTEWLLVPFSPHYGYNRGDIHVSVAFDGKDGKVHVRDRMTFGNAEFSEDFRAWVPCSTYADAVTQRFRVLDWSLRPPVHDLDSEVLDVLSESVRCMRNTDDFFAPGPHAHIATGLAGIRYFADALASFAPQFVGDDQSRMLLGVRLVDSMRTVMGDRMILQHALGLTRSLAVEGVREKLDASIGAWRQLAGRLRKESRGEVPDLRAIAQLINGIGDLEEELVCAVEELLVADRIRVESYAS